MSGDILVRFQVQNILIQEEGNFKITQNKQDLLPNSSVFKVMKQQGILSELRKIFNTLALPKQLLNVLSKYYLGS